MARTLLANPVKHWSIYRDVNAVDSPCLVVVRHAATVDAGFSGSRGLREIVDYPVAYLNGEIGYDNPRVIPYRVQSAVRRLMRGLKVRPRFYECGGCGAYHAVEFRGDCRQDDARLDPDDLDKQYGINGWDDVDPAELWPNG